jgi:hypothetical protein
LINDYLRLPQPDSDIGRKTDIIQKSKIIEDNVFDIHIKIRLPMLLAHSAVFIVLLYRRLRFGYPFRKIPLTRGKYAIVDPQDYVWLKYFKWHVAGGRDMYAVRKGVINGKKHQRLWMHREILPVPEGFVVDHINHDTLDNRRANLRPATQLQNRYNTRKRKNKSSRYKGVHWHKCTKKWRAEIKIDGKKLHLGYFHSEADAGRAYDKAARKYQGEFAELNFPDSPGR